MLRPIVALAAVLAAMPVFAQSSQSSPPLLIGSSNGPSSAPSGQAASDGTAAMAQDQTQNQTPGGVDTGTLLVGGVMVGWAAMIGTLIVNTENQTHNPISP